MITRVPTKPKPNIIKASYRLMQKVGMGPISPELVKECETFIQKNEIDFLPWALGCMDDLNAALERAMMGGSQLNDTTRQALISPIMQLKASGAMFQNVPLSQLAGSLLHFLETIPSLDQDVVAIVHANEKVLKAFLSDRGSNAATETKEGLVKALQEACNRYAAKNGLKNLF